MVVRFRYGNKRNEGAMSYKADIDLWDLAALSKNAASVGYTRFDGTHFTGDGYIPLKLTTFDATIKRLAKADAEARNYVGDKLLNAGYGRSRTRSSDGKLSAQTFTRGDDRWVCEWADAKDGTRWVYVSVKNGRVRGMPYGATSGEALQWITENGA